MLNWKEKTKEWQETKYENWFQDPKMVRQRFHIEVGWYGHSYFNNIIEFLTSAWETRQQVIKKDNEGGIYDMNVTKYRLPKLSILDPESGQYVRIHDYDKGQPTPEKVREYLQERVVPGDGLLGDVADPYGEDAPEYGAIRIPVGGGNFLVARGNGDKDTPGIEIKLEGPDGTFQNIVYVLGVDYIPRIQGWIETIPGQFRVFPGESGEKDWDENYSRAEAYNIMSPEDMI